MEKQLNFLNIFDDSKDNNNEKPELITQDNSEAELYKDLDKKDVLENDPIAFDAFERQQKEEANRLIQERENFFKLAQIDQFLLDIRGREDDLSLADFSPFIDDLNNYHIRFQGFKEQYNLAKPGLDKERIYKKIVSPNNEDKPEFRNIARLYLIYLDKVKKINIEQKATSLAPKTDKAKSKKVDNNFWNTPKFDQGKDAASGAYLDYK